MKHGRLIDADALLAQLEYLLKTSEDDAKYSGCREAAVTWNDAIYAIKIAPTIELIKQIRENEKRLGVKLIDSIGTQMHVDNGMTKEQMKEMIKYSIAVIVFVVFFALTGKAKVQVNNVKTSKIANMRFIFKLTP